MPKTRTMLYNEDFPSGRIFEIDGDELAEMQADGWKDNPALVKGHANYEPDGDDDDDEHADKLAAETAANNLTRPVGLPRRKSGSTLVSVNEGDIAAASPAKRVRKPKTADGKGKATTKAQVEAEDLSGKTENELPPRPGDAVTDAKTESELDAGEVAPMKADGE